MTNKKLTNQSIRKTTVRNLQKAGVPTTTIITMNRASRSIGDADLDDHKVISAIQSNPRPFLEQTNGPYQCLPPLQRQMDIITVTACKTTLVSVHHIPSTTLRTALCTLAVAGYE